MATKLILIEGTWGGDWAEEGSEFRGFLGAMGFDCVRFRGWTMNVDGVVGLNSDWIAGGYALRYLLNAIPDVRDRNILCHSHGIAPVLYQATLGGNGMHPLPANRLLSICSPPRKGDLEPMGSVALEKKMLAGWRHVFADGWDPWARLGQVRDRHWGWRRTWEIKHPLFTQVSHKQVGHSKLFTCEKREELTGHLEWLHGDGHGGQG